MRVSTSNLVFLFLMGFTILYPAKIFLFKALHIYVATCVALLIFLACAARFPSVIKKSFFLTAGIYIIPLSSLITTSYPSETRAALLAASVSIGLAFLASYDYRENLPKKISLITCSFSIVLLMACLIIFAIFGSLRPTSSQMSEAVGSFSNHAAAISLLSLPYLLWAIKYKLLNKILLQSAILSCMIVAILSLSRAAFIILLLILILMQLVLSRRKSHAVSKLAFICVSVLLLTYVSYLAWGESSYVAQLISRFQGSQLSLGIFDRPDRALGDFGRAAMYFEGYQMTKEYWPLGSGLGGLVPYMEEKVGFGFVSHNIVITAAGELGVVGIIGYFLIFSAISLRLLRLKKSSSNLISDLAKTSLVFIFAFLLYSFSRPFSGVFIFPIVMGLVLQLPTDYSPRPHVLSLRDVRGAKQDRLKFSD